MQNNDLETLYKKDMEVQGDRLEFSLVCSLSARSHMFDPEFSDEEETEDSGYRFKIVKSPMLMRHQTLNDNQRSQYNQSIKSMILDMDEFMWLTNVIKNLDDIGFSLSSNKYKAPCVNLFMQRSPQNLIYYIEQLREGISPLVLNISNAGIVFMQGCLGEAQYVMKQNYHNAEEEYRMSAETTEESSNISENDPTWQFI